MATFTSASAASTEATYTPIGGGVVCAAYGTIEVAANPVAADIYELCKVPAGAKILGGNLYIDDIDTGTEALDMDIGWAADTDGLGNLAVITGDVFAAGNVSNVVGLNYPFAGILVDGDFPSFTAETKIIVTCNVTANAFTAGAMSAVVYYVVP